jgi:hypothetical protein
MFITMIENIASPLTASQRGKGKRVGGSSVAAVVPVVVTVIVEIVVAAVPAAVMDAGVNWQAAPTGSPKQASVMVPVNPVDEATASEIEPDEPGAEICTVG